MCTFPVLQPCFKGTSGQARLLDPATATTATICHALNSFYGEFSDLCVQSNLDYANQMDINDGEANVKSASKVRDVIVTPFFIFREYSSKQAY